MRSYYSGWERREVTGAVIQTTLDQSWPSTSNYQGPSTAGQAGYYTGVISGPQAGLTPGNGVSRADSGSCINVILVSVIFVGLVFIGVILVRVVLWILRVLFCEGFGDLIFFSRRIFGSFKWFVGNDVDCFSCWSSGDKNRVVTSGEFYPVAWFIGIKGS
ncbi:hypothetical protein KQX54_002946 [Cotesia glomerata]|uniref:Uncharacterized protein n=1 Tax=Cotesia glomerata TaxID=32391 RepID=A0AAV7I1B5_COTGL|nr:hypothetical protein KQX54_002946 [Cotesia glomerata]